MDRSFSFCTLLFLIVSVWCKASQDQINNDLVNTNVERKVDVSTHLVKITTSITIENTGSSSVKSFLYVVDPPLQGKLSFIGAMVSFELEKFNISPKLPNSE